MLQGVGETPVTASGRQAQIHLIYVIVCPEV